MNNQHDRRYLPTDLGNGSAIALLLVLLIGMTSRPAVATVVNRQESSNIVEQVSGEKGANSPELDAAVKHIWEEINQKNIAAAMAEIQSTQKKFHGWHPDQEMTFVLTEVQTWKQINHGSVGQARRALQDFIARYANGPEAAQEHAVEASMESAVMDRRLWEALQKGATAQEMQAKIKEAELHNPAYHPPLAMLKILHLDQAAARAPILAKQNDWRGIISLQRRYPGAFSSATFPENALLLAHAQALTGNDLEASRYYLQQIQASKNVAHAQALLDNASDVLPENVVNLLYQTAREKYPDAAPQLEQWHLDYLLGVAARLHGKGQNQRAWLLLQPHLATIERGEHASNARLIASILGALDRSHAALHWWFLAAQWSGKQKDWQTAATLAVATGSTAQAGQALAHLSPDSAAGRSVFVWYFQQRALAAYRQGKYRQTLHYLHAFQEKQPLSAGMQSIAAWSLIHLHEYSHAGKIFHVLYRHDPSSGNAAGVALTDYNSHSLASAYQLAQQVPGALATFLPMQTMAANVDHINEIPWGLSAKGRVILPPTRASFLLLGTSWLQRGGLGAGSSRLQALAPGIWAQWGLNWHWSAFAQLHGDWLNSNIDSVQSTTFLGSTQTLQFAPSSGLSTWRAPSILLGVDDRLPGQEWRAALGWTSPSSLGGGSPQALLQYRRNTSTKGSYWTVEALRDAVRQSWISYNGTKGLLTLDQPGKNALVLPYQWGAAMRNQLGFAGYLAGPKTMSWNYLATLHLNAITGRNIRNNYGWTSYLSAMKPIFVNDGWWSALGPALYAEGYARNENFDSPGYGDYYSPQWLLQPQLAAAVSHWWQGGSLSLAASVGYQWARTAAASVIPVSQLPNILSTGEINQPIAEFAAAENSNISGSVDLELTQKLGQHWYFDGSAAYQANPAFAQTNIGVGIRYVFSGQMQRTLSPAALLGNMWRLNP